MAERIPTPSAVARRVLDSQAGRPVSPETLARLAYRLVLARKPSSEEIDLAREHLEKQQELYDRSNASTEKALIESVENLTHMLTSSNEFLYED